MRNRRNALAELINFKTTQKNRIEERVKEKRQSLEDTKRALLNHLRNDEKSVLINNINDKSTLLNAFTTTVKTSTPSKQSNIQKDLVTNTTNGNITTNTENNINLTLNDSNNNIGLTSVASTSTVQQKLTDRKYNFKVLTSSDQNNQKLASSIRMFTNRTRTYTSFCETPSNSFNTNTTTGSLDLENI